MKGPRPFELHEICYVDLHYDRRCCVRREIIFQTISFCGPKYEGVQLTHNNTRLTYLAPLVNYFTYDPFFEVNGSSSLSENVWERTTTTAWPFLKIVRPEDTCDGLGIEYCGKRIWEMFWTPQDRIDASPRKCPDTAIAMPEEAVAVSPDGYLLACIYSRDDSDMREEPELYVWDLRPLVRNLLWSSRKDFVMFLVGCKYLPFLGDKSKCPSENRPDNVGIVSKSLSGLALEKSTHTTLQDTLLIASPVLENLLAYEACDESRSGKHQRLVDFVFGSNELMKYIVKFL